MNRVCRVFLALFFGSLIFCQTGTPEDPFILYNTETVRFQWQNYVDAVKGEAVICLEEGAMSNPLKTITLEDETLFVKDQEGEVFLKQYTADLEDGTYWIYIRIQNHFLTWSDWNPGSVFVKNDKKPPSPGGCVILR